MLKCLLCKNFLCSDTCELFEVTKEPMKVVGELPMTREDCKALSLKLKVRGIDCPLLERDQFTVGEFIKVLSPRFVFEKLRRSAGPIDATLTRYVNETLKKFSIFLEVRTLGPTTEIKYSTYVSLPGKSWGSVPLASELFLRNGAPVANRSNEGEEK